MVNNGKEPLKLEYKYKITNELEKSLFYIFEILRREVYTRSFVSINYDILGLVFIWFKSSDNKYDDNFWAEIKNTNYIKNGNKFSDLVDEIVRKIIGNNELVFKSRDQENQFNPAVINSIIYHLDNVDLSEYKDIYFRMGLSERAIDIEISIIFYNFCIRYLELFDKNSVGKIVTNEIISDFISDILLLNSADKIIDPFAGTGSLLFKVISSGENYGKGYIVFQEINSELFNICNLLVNFTNNINIVGNRVDSLVNMDRLFVESRHNYIVTDIPFINSSQIFNKFYFSGGDESTTSNFHCLLIMHLLRNLENEGKAFIVIPDTVLFKGKSKREFRKNLVEKGYVDSIIKFEGDDKNLNRESLIILSKSRVRKDVQFIKVNKKNYEDMISSYKFRESNAFSRIVTNQEIRERDYGLMFSYYNPIFVEVEGFIRDGLGYKIKDIVNLCKPTLSMDIEIGNKYPCIKIGNLSSNQNNKYLKLNHTIKYSVPKNENNILRDEALLISLSGSDLKPTIFSPKYFGADEVYLSNGCVALIPKSEDISVEYLYYQFFNKKVLSQIEGLKRNGIISRIAYFDLLDIILIKSEVEKELKLEDYRKDSVDELENSKLMFLQKNIDFESKIIEAENQIVNMLIHNTRKYFSQIGHGVERISKYINEHELMDVAIDPENINDLNDSLYVQMGIQEKIKSETIGDVLNAINNQIETISRTFENTQKTVNLNLSEIDFEMCELCELIRDVIAFRAKQKLIQYNIIVECDCIKMKVHKESFKELINNLIVNAENHAFLKNRNDYYIKFQVEEFKNKIRIIYTNNGNKFTLPKELFILSGRKRTESKGSGLGGAYIHRVVIAHQGDFTIDNSFDGAKFIFEFGKGELL